ncbi:MAG: DUF998 domain-containing protein [Phenylobacterium sp.]|nr:DUF998 domain-containing protein [Phenylobacterium sp.]
MDRWLLRLGIAAPVLYLGGVIVGSLFYPGYSHVTQYASELGSASAARPEIFNYAIFAAGVCAVLAGLGFALVLRSLSKGWILSSLAGLSISLWGASMIMGGMFPMPDERHGGFGLGMAIQVAPLLVFLALNGRAQMTGLKTFLLLVLIASGALFAIMMGVGGLVRRADVGLWQRAYALSSIPWIAVAALCLDQAMGRRRAPAA